MRSDVNFQISLQDETILHGKFESWHRFDQSDCVFYCSYYVNMVEIVLKIYVYVFYF